MIPAAPIPNAEFTILIETPRLVLRAARSADIDVLHERIFSDTEVMRYAFAGSPLSRDQSEAFIRSHFTFGDSLTGIATLTEKPHDEIIGFAGLFACDVLGADDYEIGFVLARAAWGRGIATEIGQAQLKFGFDRLGCARLLGLVEPRNDASIHALQKIGMHYRTDIVRPNGIERCVYVMTVDDWRARNGDCATKAPPANIAP